MAGVAPKKQKLDLNELYRGEAIEKLQRCLNGIKSAIDKMEFEFNNPIDSIKEHCFKQKTKIDLRVEEMIKQIYDLRNGLFTEISTFEKESIESLSQNHRQYEKVKDLLAEPREFYDSWSSYLSNLKVSEDKVNNALKMAQIYDHFVINISDLNLDTIKVENFRQMVSDKSYFICTLGEFIIFYYYEDSRKYLVKFDKNLNQLKTLTSAELSYETLDMTSNENHIFMLTNVSKYNIHVLNQDLLIVHLYGQTKLPDSSFYFANGMNKFLIRNKKIYCLYENRVAIVDEQTGNRLKLIETKSNSIKIDLRGNMYLFEPQKSTIFIYDFNGDLLDVIQILNSPQDFDFFIDRENYIRFVLDGENISDPIKIQDP